MNDGHGKREPLADAQRQTRSSLIEIVLETEPTNQFVDARFRLVCRQVIEVRMKDEVLTYRQFGVERERLRHIPDAIARADVVRVQRLAEQQRFAFGRRQQAREHFHRRRLAAAVRAKEPENLAAVDGEAHAIDRREVAETAGQIARNDDRRSVDDPQRRDDERLVVAALGLGQKSDERLLQRRRARGGFQSGRRPRRKNVPGVHRRQPFEPFGLLHVSGGDHNAHTGFARAHAVDQFPELSARKRIDPGRRLVEDQKIRIVDQATAKPELLAHAS